MKYHKQKMDGRHNYNDRFKYYLNWPISMNYNRGPLHFNHALQWCIQTWGWSAEVRQYYELLRWKIMCINHPQLVPSSQDLDTACNTYWTWSNQFNSLRIYLRSEQELSWFQLAHPVDSQ